MEGSCIMQVQTCRLRKLREARLAAVRAGAEVSLVGLRYHQLRTQAASSPGPFPCHSELGSLPTVNDRSTGPRGAEVEPEVKRSLSMRSCQRHRSTDAPAVVPEKACGSAG